MEGEIAWKNTKEERSGRSSGEEKGTLRMRYRHAVKEKNKTETVESQAWQTFYRCSRVIHVSMISLKNGYDLFLANGA